MNYFEFDIQQEPIIRKGGTTKWLFDKPYTHSRKQLKKTFVKKEYDKVPSKYLHFRKLKDEFVCANPECKSKSVECIWYEYQGIDLGVDETFAEFYCSDCEKYTFVEYYRDDS